MFNIKILRHHWIKDDGQYDQDDLCAHGEMLVQINDEILSDASSGSWCTTAAVLHLMRSALKSYAPDDFCGQLIPCCGHFMVIDPEKSEVSIMGCNNGIDFSVTHENDFVVLATNNADSCRVSSAEFQQEIINLSDKVEKFYGPVEDKVLPPNSDDQKAFESFWVEWQRLKNELTVSLAS